MQLLVAGTLSSLTRTSSSRSQVLSRSQSRSVASRRELALHTSQISPDSLFEFSRRQARVVATSLQHRPVRGIHRPGHVVVVEYTQRANDIICIARPRAASASARTSRSPRARNHVLLRLAQAGIQACVFLSSGSCGPLMHASQSQINLWIFRGQNSPEMGSEF